MAALIHWDTFIDSVIETMKRTARFTITETTPKRASARSLNHGGNVTIRFLVKRGKLNVIVMPLSPINPNPNLVSAAKRDLDKALLAVSMQALGIAVTTPSSS